MIKRIQIRVTGRVQGVYFRAFTEKQARKLGVKGSVKNLTDGRVEIIAEAEQDQLDKMIAWCHKGPLLANVTHVDTLEQPIDTLSTSFSVIK